MPAHSKMPEAMQAAGVSDVPAFRRYLAGLVQAKGQVGAARQLGVSRETLTVWLLKLGIQVQRVVRTKRGGGLT